MTETRKIGVAVAVPEPWGTDLRDWRARLGDPQATTVPTHVTLVPPVEVPLAELGRVEKHLLAVAEVTASFPLELRGTDSFRPVSPVAFVRVVRGRQALTALERSIRSGPLLRELAFPYHPHVTVAHDLPDAALDRACRELADYQASFRVVGFVLYGHGTDEVWRPQRDYVFGGPLPQPAG